MKFKQYIMKEEIDRKYGKVRTKILEYNEWFTMVESKCKKSAKAFLEGKARIYRGRSGEGAFVITDPSKGNRLSANTKNYMTLIIDNLPSWKSFPKRSESLICTTDTEYVENYGDTYIVLPFDGSKIGVCRTYDWWDSFRNLENIGENVDSFNNIIHSFFEQYKIKVDETSWNSLKKGLMNLEKEKPRDDMINGLLMNLLDSETKILNIVTDESKLDKFLSPTSNKHKLVKAGEPIKNTEAEVWTDGKCLLTSMNEKELLKEFKSWGL